MQDKEKKKRKSVIPIIVIAIVIGIILFLYEEKNNNPKYDGNSLIGIFLYEENKTKYVFKEDGTGSMYSDEYKYDYTYEINENVLSIDFLKNEVHDVAYYFELNNGVLKLTSKEGTIIIDKEYILKKVNK